MNLKLHNITNRLRSSIYPLLLAGIALIAPMQNAKSEVIEIDPLFEYPMAPEEMTSIQDRSNWLIEHFWDKMDFKNKSAQNQVAVNDAMMVFVTPMQWAEEKKVNESVEKLLKSLKKNPTLLYQFTKAAEDNMYGPKAELWVDNVYTQFLESFLKNKKIPKERKLRYERQLKQLKNCRINEKAPSFSYETPTGDKGNFRPTGVYTIIEFGDPDCDDCRMSKLKMETDINFSSLVDKGLVNVMFIVADPTEGWQTRMTGFSPKWTIGASEEVGEELDLRHSPSFYVVNKEGKLVGKNLNYVQAMRMALQDNSQN